MCAIFIILGFIGVAIAAPSQTQRIVGGTTTTVERYPYMANMQYGYFGSFYQQMCGGSLINEQSVLSAAHCYEGDSASSWRVVLGASLTSGTDGTAHALSRLIVHERYNVGIQYDNDVAVVILTTRATLSNKIGLATIAGPNYNLADGTIVTAIGFGRLYVNGPQPTELQHVQIPTISHQDCQNRYTPVGEEISPGMLCSGILDVGGQDACSGDSGGPVAHGPNWDIIIGVTSWGYGCAHALYPGVNARVSYYSDWIVANAQ